MVNERIKNTVSFYVLCSRLKDTIRKGPLVWNANRERIESVAEHIYGTQMLAISVYYQFGYKLDLNKIIYMIAVHELEEIETGDLAFYEITKEEKTKKSKEAIGFLLKDFLGKDEIVHLLDEYSERKTPEAIFAHHCDKLECDIQIKLYDQEGCFDLGHQPNNPIINTPNVRKVLESENSISNAWIEFDRDKYEDDPIFIDIIDWLKGNDI
ncbi:HD domain-containing protein [Candidatus Saccharibacteria bacterium]|nr:HD domain-containing protein [Candidatus Saccharibacteria bacterium]